MQKYQNNVTGRNGDVVIGGSVLVRLAGTATPATIYSDNGVTPADNPLTTDANGYFEFYVADGLYDITVNGQDAYTSVLIVDALTGLAGRPTNSALAASGAAAAIGTTAGTVQSDLNARPTTADLAASGGAGLVKGTWFGGIVAFLSDMGTSIGASLIGFIQGGTGAIARSLQAKLRETVSISDFGAVGDGVVDDTVAIQNALASSNHVIVPQNFTPLISSTIVVPTRKRLEFLGGQGNTVGALPPSRFIKKSTMTTPALQLESCAVVTGGGLFCQPGNTGDGIQLIGNGAELHDFYEHGAGGVGVRIGRSDTTYANVNSCTLSKVRANNNGSHGIYAHDNSTTSASAGSSDVNCGSLIDCKANGNGGDGIKLGNAWWWTVSNALTQINTGWGFNLSSTIIAPAVVAECRYANIFGGDFNEGNTAGSANIAGYAAKVFMADGNQVMSVTGTACGVYGDNATISGAFSGASSVLSQSVGTTPYPLNVRNYGNSSNGRGVGILFSPPNGSNTTRSGGQIAVEQSTTNQDLMRFSVNVSGTMTDMLKVDPNGLRIIPPTDASVNLGHGSLRWLGVYGNKFYPGAAGSIVFWTSGSGSPEGVLSGPVGSLFTRTDGGAATTLYVKESGAGNTGWVAK